MAAAQEEARSLLAWQPVPVSDRLLEAAWSVERESRLSFWDSLIVAAAHECRCAYLLSEALQDGQDFDGVRVVNPFGHGPGDLGLGEA